MLGHLARLGALAITCMAIIVASGPDRAEAAFGVSKFEAGTCAENTEPIPPLGTGPGQCTFDTPARFFTQAGGHPPFGIVDFAFNTNVLGGPEGNVLNVRTDLPRGLSVNPEAVDKCTEAQLVSLAGCPSSTQVGVNHLTSYAVVQATIPVNVYNMVPPPGKPLMAGMNVPLVGPIYLVGNIDWSGDYHEFFTISNIPSTVPLVRNRLVFEGDVGDGFIRQPSTCVGPQRTVLNVDSHQAPGEFLTYNADTPVGGSGCADQPFAPEIEVAPSTTRTDSPTGLTVDVKLPDPGGPLRPSDVRDASVTLPAGMSLNPAAVSGLATCTDAQFGQGSRNSIACPAGSRIGSASIETPVLPPGSLTGGVYVGRPLSTDPATGKQFRIFFDASSVRYGVSVRLTGEVAVDPASGRLTTRLHDLPQAPFSTMRVRFDGGPDAVLSTPPTCGPHTASARFTPWSGQPAVAARDSFTLSGTAGGGACAAGPGARPFAPGFTAATTDPTAGSHTDLRVGFTRRDGEQELKGVHLSLPPGLIASLRGVPYCSPAAIAAAARRDGSVEKASPSCPAASRIGSVAIKTGTGPSPFQVTGQAYLAGPYGGAPLSMAVITPALAGPYDLGTVVVRVALRVDPKTLEIRAESDPIPDRVRGVALGIREIAVSIDRPRFSLNPTACWEKYFTGSIFGGGANPANPGAWSSVPIQAAYRAASCGRLGFAPKFYTRFFGGRGKMRRNGHPPFRAVLRPRSGDANIRRVAVRLPRAVILDQGNIRTTCTRAQYAADNCPRRSIYGRAVARSPLLNGPLRGPVYLRSSDNPLPDLVAALHGQIRVELVGRIDSFRGALRTTYDFVPDAPVSHFALRLFGGRKRGLLVVSKDLCARHRKAVANFRAQNGKKRKVRPKLRVTSCRGRRSG